MAGNTINVQGSYIDVHDNEVVNLNVDKAEVKVDKNANLNQNERGVKDSHDEELTFLLHPAIVSNEEQWKIHDEIKRLVRAQGVQEICNYLWQMRSDNRILLPESPGRAYEELVRLGMPNGEGFNPKTFQKYYRR